ncbi:MAG: host attachment protein [Sulfitobacter sp.]|nr:host attachment protein [Sulfitobacter sp.]
MKPTITWVVLANTRATKVLSHQGPGKGLMVVAGKKWQADTQSLPRDKAGVGHSIAGPAVSAVEQSDAKKLSDMRLAKEIVADLSKDYQAKKYQRLILVSGPHMLGLLRAEIEAPLRKALIGEIPKDLSAMSVDQVEKHLGELIAV